MKIQVISDIHAEFFFPHAPDFYQETDADIVVIAGDITTYPRVQQGHPLNPYFVTDVGDLIGDVPLWIHGHVHNNFDYTLGSTRIVANPFGYIDNGVPENPLYTPTLVVDTGTFTQRERT